MADVKIAVVYYSTYGTNYQMAQAAAEAAREAGADVRLRKVRETAPQEVVQSQEQWAAHARSTEDVAEATPDDLVWADGYIFSSPTRYGGASSQMRSFIDTLGPIWQEGKLANKTATAMTSASNAHGGQETTLQTMYVTFMHWGTILVPPGYTDPSVFASGGNPYGASVTAGDELSDEMRTVIQHQARRLVEVTTNLKDGIEFGGLDEAERTEISSREARQGGRAGETTRRWHRSDRTAAERE